MLKIERPWTRQPTGAALIRESIAATLVWNGARPEVEYVGGYKTAAIGTNLIGSGIGGQGIQFTSVSSGISVGVTSDAIKSLSTATIAIYRRHTDTTNRNSVVFSNGASSTDTITVYGPWGDGNAYFDWGNSTVGSGRLSAAFGAKTTDYEALVCVAGGGKGREIWRNGIRLGANTSATASITSSSAVLRLGFLTSGIAGDLENVALLVVSSRAWSDTEIVAWSRNPYGATFAPRRIWVPVTAASGSSYSQNISGSLTLSNGLYRGTTKSFLGSTTLSNTINKNTTKTPLTSSITTTSGITAGGNLSQSTTGNITPTSVLTDTVNYVRNYSSSITLTGGIVNAIAKFLNGTISISGALNKLITKYFSGSITKSGSVSGYKFTPSPEDTSIIGNTLTFIRRFIGRR